ncbi:hypothetical protein WJX81_000646 [Elliptochloris bilobata]|uniref:Protein kinase domain-containing protein n=1 Tax=Elliptochloris bilobata TaxID=381761 RepID=A0AAW1QWF4_9CHLO
MHGMRHPNVLRLYASFVSEPALWMVMPFVSGGSLSSILATKYHDGMEEELIVTIARDVLVGPGSLHSNGFTHRDLKASNLLVAEDGRILLADFGVCATLEHVEATTAVSESNAQASLDSGASPDVGGTSPLQVQDSSSSVASSPASGGSSQWGRYLSRSTFLWHHPAGAGAGLRCTDLALFTFYKPDQEPCWPDNYFSRKVPFAHHSLTSIVLRTVLGDAPTLASFTEHSPHKFSEQAAQFVSLCLNKDAGNRPLAAALLKHAFIKKARDGRWLAQRLLAVGRGGGGSAKFGSSPQVSFSDASKTVAANAAPGQKAPRTLWSGRGSGTTMRQRGSSSGSEASAQATKAKLVHRLTWTLSTAAPRASIVFEITAWYGKARIGFNYDEYTVRLPKDMGGGLLEIEVSMYLTVMLRGSAKLDGLRLPMPAYTNTEALRAGQASAGGSAAAGAAACASPAGVPALVAVAIDTKLQPEAKVVARPSPTTVLEAGATSHVPLSPCLPGDADGPAIGLDPGAAAPLSSASSASSATPRLAAIHECEACLVPEDALAAPASPFLTAAITAEAAAGGQESRAGEARAEAAAAADAAVEAALARLAVDFQKRERMLLAAVAARSERERELLARLDTLERRERMNSDGVAAHSCAEAGMA